MKRTLTAAATLLAGSAGAVGFAGTAAAETPELPAELPVDNNLAQTVYHAAGTLHSAKAVVGDVVPAAQQQLTARAPQPVQDVQDAVGGTLAGPVGDVAQGVAGSPVGDVVGGTPVGGLADSVVGDTVGGVTGRAASSTGALPTDALPVQDLPTDALPVQDLPTDALPTGDLPVGDVVGAARSGSAADVLPVENLPVENLPVQNLPVGDAVTGLTGSLPIGG